MPCAWSCKINGDAGSYTFMPDSGLATLFTVPDVNVYGTVSPFNLQGLAQGTMCTQGRTCVRHEVMCKQQRVTFYTELIKYS